MHYKLRHSLIALACLIATATSAQKMAFGVRGGLNFANQSDGTVSADARTAGAFGLYFNTSFANILSFQAEALYVGKGNQQSFLGLDVISGYEYIEIPLLIRVGPNVGPVHLFAQAGLSPAFLIGTFASAGGTTVSGSTDGFQTFELSLPMGIGAEFNLSKVQLQLDLRYNLGLTGVIADVPSGLDNIKNRGIMVMAGVGYRF